MAQLAVEQVALEFAWTETLNNRGVTKDNWDQQPPRKHSRTPDWD